MITTSDIPYHHQIPPYGRKGDPYIVTKHNLLYPGKFKKLNWSCLQKKRLDEQLNKCFPSTFVIIHCIILILNSLAQIGLQIALMVTNGALWFVASGIWAGVYFLLTAFITLFLIKFRYYSIYLTSYIMHLFGILVAIGAYLVVNLIAISEYRTFCTYYPNCFNQEVKPINYVMFFLGVALLISLLFYLVFMPFYIMDVINQRKKHKQEAKIAELNSSNEKDGYYDILKHGYLYAQHNLNSNNNGIVNIQVPMSLDNLVYEHQV